MISLDGKSLKQSILDKVRDEVGKLSVKPKLVVIQVGNDEASNIYISQKAKMAAYVGYEFVHLKHDKITEDELIKEIEKLNNDSSVHAILVQIPLPNGFNKSRIQNAIIPEKDVDGLTDINMGKLAHNKDGLCPCTPAGIITLLKKYNVEIASKHAVVVGRSDLVGKPMALMLLRENATVTICHSKTKDLAKYTKEADILVVAAGVAGLVNEDMVKDGAVVVDVGINRINNKLVGDVTYDTVSKKASYITPVPGGVGQMTVATLCQNVLKAYKLQGGNGK